MSQHVSKSLQDEIDAGRWRALVKEVQALSVKKELFVIIDDVPVIMSEATVQEIKRIASGACLD